MKPKRAFALVLQVLAAGILAVSVLLIAAPDLFGKDPRIAAWTGFLMAVGAFAALMALAVLIGRENTAPPEVRDALSRLQQQLMVLEVKLKEIQLMSDRAGRAPAAPPSAAASGTDYGPQLSQLSAALAELRELSLLPDTDRRQRLQVHRDQKKATQVKEVFGMVAAHEWQRAERTLITLETEFPNDSDVAKARSYLDHSRHLFEEETVIRASREIEELVAAAAWDHAWKRLNELAEGFPDSGDVQTLRARVEREFNVYQETTCQRMFEEIRHDIDRRMWKRALMHAEALLKKFPTHRLADTIRGQMQTLQDNAEIQERQEVEVRIQELIRDQQFDEAIELAEDVMRRFPLSPQAESLERLLPRIRELARGAFEATGTGE